MRIDHVGVAVEDIEAAKRFYGRSFGLKVLHEENVASQKVKVAFLGEGPGAAAVELLQPLDGGGAVARFLEKKGPGIHHVAFHTGSIAADMERLKKQGRPALEDGPRPGARGHKVCFLHPKHCGGVLIELVEGDL